MHTGGQHAHAVVLHAGRVPSRHASTHLAPPPTANQSSSELAGCRRRADSGARGVRELQASATQQYQLLRRGGDWPWATCRSHSSQARPSSRHWNVRGFKNSPRLRGLAIPPAAYSASGQLAAAPVNMLALNSFLVNGWLCWRLMCAAHAFRRVLSSRPLPAVHVPRSPVPMAVGDAHVRIAVGLATTLLWQTQLPACLSLVQGSRNQHAVPGFPMLRAGS